MSAATAGTVVVVGASLAGATGAFTLRERGFTSQIVLIGAETELPYERPALSKSYLAGETPPDKLLVRPADAYDEHQITLRLGHCATALDIDRRIVTVDSRDVLSHDHLVIATGASNVRPSISGIDLAGVYQLRAVADADALREELPGLRTAVVVGQGFIGCEITATLTTLGVAVTAVDAAPGPLWGPLGPQLSQLVRRWHSDRGARLINDVGVSAFLGDDAGRVRTVELADGQRLDADLVIVGVGVRPATGWLQDTPVHLVRGAIGVDTEGRTNLRGVYAAGDVTATWDDELASTCGTSTGRARSTRASASPTPSPARRSPRRRTRRSGPTSTTATCSTWAATRRTATSSSAATLRRPTRRCSRSSCAPAASPQC